MRRLLIVFIMLSVIFLMSGAQASYTLEQSSVSRISSGGSLFAEFRGDLLTVDIRDSDLEEVLKQISRQEGIKFLLHPSLGKEKVMVRFSNLKIDKGLGKILSNYDHIFIYGKDDTSNPPLPRLTEVRIYPRPFTGGGLKEPLACISESSTLRVSDAGECGGQHQDTQLIKLQGKKSVGEVSSDLTAPDSRVKVAAIKELASIGGEGVIAPLASVLRDKNAEVKKEAEKALEKIGESLKGPEGESNDLQPSEEEKPSDNEEGRTNLVLTPLSANDVNLELTNDIPVRGVQFTLTGAQPIEVRTTSRSEGFLAKFNERNGTVVMVSLSGKTIAPGTGPIAEIVCNNGSSARLSGVTIGK